MKKYFLLIMTALVLLSLAACGKTADVDISGRYETYVDLRASIVEAFDKGTSISGLTSGISLGDYLGDAGLTVVFELGEDGSYRRYVDEKSVEKTLASVHEAAKPYLDDYMLKTFEEMFSSYGAAVEGREAIEELLGCSIEESFTAAIGVDTETFIARLVSESLSFDGVYQAVNAEGRYKAADGRLRVSGSAEAEPAEDAYEVYKINNDSLTVTEGVNVQPYLSYPFDMVKVN